MKYDFLLGAELEFELPPSKLYNKHTAYTSVLQKIVKNDGTVINQKGITALHFGNFKYDGTINYGFEYATLPYRAFSWLNNKNLKNLKDIFIFFKQHKVSIGNHVGMHVHVDKNDLTNEEIKKINFFIYRNTKFCEMIGERKLTKYCRLNENTDDVLNINWNKSKQFCGDHRYNSDVGSKTNHKHRMLNVARPKTIEFRFFKSTNNYKTFLKNIQFVIALVNFVKEKAPTLNEFQIGGASIGGGDDLFALDAVEGLDTITKKFCDFVHKNNKTYFELAYFLMKKGY
jgi:hypothetical protein